MVEFRPYKIEINKKLKRNDFDKEINNPCFIGATTYNKTYVNWGAAPAIKP